MERPHGTNGSSRIRSNPGCGAVLWFFIVLWFGGLGFMVWMDPGSACAVAPFALVGFILVGIAVATGRSRARYGASQFEKTAPAFPGGRLEGVVLVPRPVGPDAYIRLTLTSLRRGDADSPDRVLWRGVEFVAPPPAENEGQGRIPVRIDIPATGVPTDPGGRADTCYWNLQVYAERGCPGLDVSFDVPVEPPPAG